MINLYKRHRFPPAIIQYAVWLYYRFNLSIRDVEDLLAERNISVSYESIRLRVNKFGPEYGNRLRRRHPGFGDTYFLDEVFVKIRGTQHYLWRAVDQDGVPSLDGASSMYICKRKETPQQQNVSSNVFLKQGRTQRNHNRQTA